MMTDPDPLKTLRATEAVTNKQELSAAEGIRSVRDSYPKQTVTMGKSPGQYSLTDTSGNSVSLTRRSAPTEESYTSKEAMAKIFNKK
jgi:hypothetical protein